MSELQDLSADDIKQVRASFDRIWPVSTRTADLFYARLFDIAPETRPLFRRDMDEQKRKFMATLAVIVGSLDDSGKLVPLTDTLARQHGTYGIGAAHYVVVGDALLWSLERGLGENWTPDVAAAWSRAYGVVSKFMIAHTPQR